MLQYYISNQEGVLSQIDSIQKNCWINMMHPTEEEIRSVSSQLEIPLNFIIDALDNDDQSRIERDEEKILIIVDFPVITYDEFNSATYETIPLGMIITNQHFITVCLRENQIVDEFSSSRIRHFFTFKKTRFALQIVYAISTYYLRYLKQIIRNKDEIEKY